jgi:hypothetical protein
MLGRLVWQKSMQVPVWTQVSSPPEHVQRRTGLSRLQMGLLGEVQSLSDAQVPEGKAASNTAASAQSHSSTTRLIFNRFHTRRLMTGCCKCLATVPALCIVLLSEAPAAAWRCCNNKQPWFSAAHLMQVAQGRILC